MLPYILRRAAAGVILAVLVTFITFWLLSFSFDGVVKHPRTSGVTGGNRSAEGADGT